MLVYLYVCGAATQTALHDEGGGTHCTGGGVLRIAFSGGDTMIHPTPHWALRHCKLDTLHCKNRPNRRRGVKSLGFLGVLRAAGSETSWRTRCLASTVPLPPPRHRAIHSSTKTTSTHSYTELERLTERWMSENSHLHTQTRPTPPEVDKHLHRN